MRKMQDLTGQRFGRLTVQRYAGKTTWKRPQNAWECICDCGNTKTISGTALLSGGTKSCGCLQKENARHAAETQRKHPKELAGMRFGRLTAIKPGEIIRWTNRNEQGWECVCDCGKTVLTSRVALVTGGARSCGCSKGRKKHAKE